MSTLADALRGGGKFVSWDDIGQGTVVTGTVTDVTMRQSRKFQSDELDTWDDGTPKMQAVIEVQTALRDAAIADDDGRRSIVVNLWSGQKRALAEACRKAGIPEPRVGDTFAAVWTSGAGGAKDPRVFAYQVTAGSGLAAAMAAPTPAPAPAVDPFASAALPADHAMAPTAGDPLAGFTPEQRAALAALAAQQQG